MKKVFLSSRQKDTNIAQDHTQIPPIRPLPTKHYIPLPSLGDEWAGRVTDLWAIHDGLTNQNTTVIQGAAVMMGLGGIGKTQLAEEYVHRFASHYPGGVFWVDVELGRLTMIARVAQAAEMELNNTLPEADQLNLL